MPYQLIGILVAFFLGVWAFIVAETPKSRIIIALAMVSLVLLPKVWLGPTATVIIFIGWIVFGIGCYIFIRFKRAGLN